MSLASQPSLQSELLLSDSSSPDMRHAARQMSHIQNELSARSKFVLRTVSRWLDIYEYVSMIEQERIQKHPLVGDYEQHFRGVVALAKGLGLMLLARLQNDDAAQLQVLGLTYSDLSACVQELVDVDRALQSDITPEMAAMMESRLFGCALPER